jgi:N-acetylneuraminic acid mutarotase
MKTISEYITILNNTKNNMITKLNSHGLNVSQSDSIYSLSNKIGDIESGVRLNIFSQTEQPTTYDGIWINTSSTVNKLAQVEDFLSEWNDTYGTPMPYNVYYINSIELDNKIYIIGGKNSSNNAINNVIIYNTILNTWTEATPMPVNKMLFGMNLYNRKIFCFGGNTGSDVVSTIHIYDIDTDSWETNSVNLPSARYAFDSVIDNDNVYIICGGNSSYASTSTNYKYNITNNNFTTMTSMPASRAYSGYCISDGKIYIGGGIISSTLYSNLYIYSISENAWINGSSMPTIKRGMKFNFYNNNIYSICGSTTDANEVNTNHIYSISENAWTIQDPAPYINSYYASCIYNNIIYIFGGGINASTAKKIIMMYSLNGPLNISLYNSDTLIMQHVNSYQPYSTILTSSNTYIGGFKYPFTDVAINGINADIYYGDGSQWIKIKSKT